jgi:hypothetical protein
VAVRGLRALQARFTRIGKSPKVLKSVEVVLFRGGHKIMRASQRIVPVDKGPLKNSGLVDPPVLKGRKVEVTLGYGDSTVGYAIHVHENPRARHRSPTRFKYLEEPYLQMKDEIMRDVIAAQQASFAKLSRGI